MTFIPPDGIETKSSYQILASPTLYSGQMVTATLAADQTNQQAVDVTLFVRVYGVDDAIESIEAPTVSLGAGVAHTLEWRVPDTHGAPIMAIGVRIDSAVRADGTVYLDRLDWSGTPTLNLIRPVHAGRLWRRAWVDAVDILDPQWPEMFRLAHNRGTGMISLGTADWYDYTATATIIPHMFASGGLAVHVQGLRRYYALQFVAGGYVQLIKQHDDATTVLAQIPFEWQQATTYELQVSIVHGQITAQVGGHVLHAFDPTWRYGGVGLVCTEGRFACERVTVQP
jgi:hypothetical protein